VAILKFVNNLTPFIPLSMIGISSYHEGETRKRGASAPLRHPRRGGKYQRRVKERRSLSSITNPLPLVKGKGKQGIGLINDVCI